MQRGKWNGILLPRRRISRISREIISQIRTSRVQRSTKHGAMKYKVPAARRCQIWLGNWIFFVWNFPVRQNVCDVSRLHSTLSKILSARKMCRNYEICIEKWNSKACPCHEFVMKRWLSRRHADRHTIMAAYLGFEFQSTLKQIHLDVCAHVVIVEHTIMAVYLGFEFQSTIKTNSSRRVRACRYRRYSRDGVSRLNCPRERYETIGIFPSRSITRKSVSESFVVRRFV